MYAASVRKALAAGSHYAVSGFRLSGLCREKRPVSEEFIDFLRKEQRAKVVGIFNGTGRERLSRVRTQ